MIYFVRHGETDFNLFDITQGQLDSSLNYNGLKQVKAVAEKLKNKSFDVVFCSPLTRAKQTFEEINKYHNLKPIYDKRLMEVGKGRLQGKINPQSVYDKFYKNPHRYGGESEVDVFNRVSSFFADLEKHRGKNILIVGHGGIKKYFEFCLNKKNLKDDGLSLVNMDNCEIVTYKF